MGTWESFGTPKTLEFNYRDQNTTPWNVFYIIGKLSKHKCRKWPRMNHLDICNTRYGKKKGWKSNWQFDFRPLKVNNRPDSGVCRKNVTHCWKVLKETYKFASDLVSIRCLSKELWICKVPGVQTTTISKFLLGSPRKKNHSDVGAMERCKEYYMGEDGGFPRVRAMVSLVSPKLLVAYPSTKGAPESELTNLLVGLMQVRVSK
jgi:hypothetical protein